MPGFEDARRAKDAAVAKKAAEDASADILRQRRIEGLRDETARYFEANNIDATVKMSGDKLVLDSPTYGYLDIIARDGGKFFLQRGNVKGATIATGIVRDGREIPADHIFSAIIEWIDGDLR